MRVGFVEWPDGLQAHDPSYKAIERSISTAVLDVLVTNDLPFGEWIAARSVFDRAAAQRSIDLHAEEVAALADLSLSAVVTSRPVWSGERLANEAVVLRATQLHPWRRKRYFPAEPGWFETEWYTAGEDDFPVMAVAGAQAGVLLCTEAMFNERARRYGRAGADLIAIPRATGPAAIWQTACQMAGRYVVSSSRRMGQTASDFGGNGCAYAPDVTLLATTNHDNWLSSIDLDTERSYRQRSSFPCYVAE